MLIDKNKNKKQQQKQTLRKLSSHGLLVRGRDSTDWAQRGPYENDRAPIFAGTARAS